MRQEIPSDDTGSPLISTLDKGQLRYITIRRQHRANALSITMLDAIANAITSLTHCKSIGAVVLSAPGKTFCAGADMEELRFNGDKQYEALRNLIEAFHKRSVPVVCVMQGKAFGAGCLLPALADVVIASDAATYSFPEIKFGLYPSLIYAVLTEKLSEQLVYSLCIGGKSLSAHDALYHGLVTEILPSIDFSAEAQKQVDFYTARTTALNSGREMRVRSAGQALMERISTAEDVIARNLAAPDVDAMLTEYRK